MNNSREQITLPHVQKSLCHKLTKGIIQTSRSTATNTRVVAEESSLALVREALAVMVDPGGSSNKPRQESNHSTQAAGHGPDLEAEKK